MKNFGLIKRKFNFGYNFANTKLSKFSTIINEFSLHKTHYNESLNNHKNNINQRLQTLKNNNPIWHKFIDIHKHFDYDYQKYYEMLFDLNSMKKNKDTISSWQNFINPIEEEISIDFIIDNKSNIFNILISNKQTIDLEKTIQKCISSVTNFFGANSKEAAEIYFLLSLYYEKTKIYVNCESNAIKCLEILKNNPDTNNSIYLILPYYILSNLYETYYKDYKESYLFLAECERIINSNEISNQKEIIEITRFLVWKKLGDYNLKLKDNLSNIQKSLNYFDLCLNHIHINSMINNETILTNYLDIVIILGDNFRKIDYSHKSYEIYKKGYNIFQNNLLWVQQESFKNKEKIIISNLLDLIKYSNDYNINLKYIKREHEEFVKDSIIYFLNLLQYSILYNNTNASELLLKILEENYVNNGTINTESKLLSRFYLYSALSKKNMFEIEEAIKDIEQSRKIIEVDEESNLILIHLNQSYFFIMNRNVKKALEEFEEILKLIKLYEEKEILKEKREFFNNLKFNLHVWLTSYYLFKGDILKSNDYLEKVNQVEVKDSETNNSKNVKKFIDLYRKEIEKQNI